MSEFFVRYEGSRYSINSKVYAIDTVRHEFLIADVEGYYDAPFMWVSTDDCVLISKEEVDA